MDWAARIKAVVDSAWDPQQRSYACPLCPSERIPQRRVFVQCHNDCLRAQVVNDATRLRLHNIRGASLAPQET